MSAGASLQTPLGELTALPQTPLLYLGGLLLKGRDGRGEERKKGKGRGGGEEGEGEERKGERRGGELSFALGKKEKSAPIATVAIGCVAAVVQTYSQGI